MQVSGLVPRAIDGLIHDSGVCVSEGPQSGRELAISKCQQSKEITIIVCSRNTHIHIGRHTFEACPCPFSQVGSGCLGL